MTKEGFESEFLYYEEYINTLHKKQQELMDEYIKEFCPYKIGDIYIDNDEDSFYNGTEYEIIAVSLKIIKDSDKINILGYAITLKELGYDGFNDRRFIDSSHLEKSFKQK